MAGLGNPQINALNFSMQAAKDINLGTLVNCMLTSVDTVQNAGNVTSTVLSSYIGQIDATSTVLNSYIGQINANSSVIARALTYVGSTSPVKSFFTAIASEATTIDLGVGANTLSVLFAFDQYTSAGLAKTTGITALAIDGTTKTIINVTGTANAGWVRVFGF